VSRTLTSSSALITGAVLSLGLVLAQAVDQRVGHRGTAVREGPETEVIAARLGVRAILGEGALRLLIDV
jgi:hypothetical protein